MFVDVLVVGGGPIGGQTARLFAAKGHSVLLVEEHARVGEPVQCAGLFTPRVFEHVAFPLEDVWLNDIRGAHVRSPGGRTIALDGGKTMAVATDRAKFDRLCVESAAKAGAEVRTSTKCVHASYGDGGNSSATKGGARRRIRAKLVSAQGEESVECRLLVGADGVQSAVAKWFGLPRAKEILPCYGAQVEGTLLEPGYVEMFLGSGFAPGFFSWMIPTDPKGLSAKVEVGTGFNAARPAKDYYDRMWTDPSSARFLRPDAHPVFDICGCIPLGPLASASQAAVTLVGDAAAQTKPTSGGGVYTGLKCAEHLVEVGSDALERDDVSAEALQGYEKRWREDIGRELAVGWRLRKAFCRLRDDQVDRLFEVLDDREILETMNVLGDIDYPSRLARALFRKAPSLLQFAGPAARSLLD